jgi:glucokinase
MDDRYAIGVDIGGTRIRVALSDEKGRFLSRIEEKIDLKNEKAISGQIIRVSHYICKNSGIALGKIEKIGISSAGPLDLRKGLLIKPTNLPFPIVPLTEPVSGELGIPTFLLNDCAAGVLGEKNFGAGKNVENLVFVAQGTGIGGGAIVDNTLLSGKDGNAVEIGHFTIDMDGRLKCGCGRRGHWEAYCSGRNIPNFVRLKIKEADEKRVKNSLLFKNTIGNFKNLDSKALFTAAKLGDSLSLEIVEDIGRLNAMGFANVVNAYDPSLITVGGSLALRNKKLSINPMKRHLQNYAINRIPKIMITPLGEDANLYGAIAVALS